MDPDLNSFIEGYINRERGDFIYEDADDLAQQFMDETNTYLDFETIRDEIEWRQDYC